MLQRHGFKELSSDTCIYFKTTSTGLVSIAIYDILVAAKDKDTVAEIKNMLAQEYTVVIERYLSIEIEKDPVANTFFYTNPPTFSTS